MNYKHLSMEEHKEILFGLERAAVSRYDQLCIEV